MNVLMVGPARSVKGGMTSVVDSYYDYGLDKKINLKYLESSNDKNKILKAIKEITGFCKFKLLVKKYDIIHIHMASRRSTYRKCKYIKEAKKAKKKVIVHVHGAEFKVFYDKECNESQKRYIKECLNMCDKIIVLSEEWEEYFQNIVPRDKIEVIYNAINIPKDFEKNTETKQILFLGRLGERKGIYDLIDVVEQLISQYKDIKLIACGDGEYEKVKKIVEDRKLKSNIEIYNWISGKEKEEKLKNSSFYVLPSYNEGMPMSLIEGMAYKNIPISTKVGGIPRVIENGINGFIIEPGDKKKLKEILENILDDKEKEKRKQISDNARKTVEEKFNIKKNIEKLLRIYKEME